MGSNHSAVSAAGRTGEAAQGAAHETRRNPAVEWAARLGFAAYGVVYLVVAWLSVQLINGGHEQVSGKGALQELARQPLGGVVLWVAFAGFCALVLWQALTVIVGPSDKSGWKAVVSRVSSGLRCIVFAGLAVSTFRIETKQGGGSSASNNPDGWTARLMGMPAGPLLVGIAGAIIIGYGIYSIIRGVTDRWRKEVWTTGSMGRVTAWLARGGYAGRGVAFGVIGGLFIWAAFTHDPHHAGGLDQALATMRNAPLGPLLLVLVALGLACYGAFNVMKVKKLRT